MNLPQITRILNEFERESATMDMKEEMMSESVDDVMADEAEDEEEASDKILEEVLAEIGVSVEQQVPHPLNENKQRAHETGFAQLGETPTTAPPTSIAEGKQKTAVAEGGGDDLQARLDNLRKD
jgi:charged multivesicular body protein 2A